LPCHFSISVRDCVEELRRAVTIHEHLPGDRAQAELVGFLEQYVDRLRMNRAVNRRGGHAVAEALREKDSRDFARMPAVAKALLGDEGISLEPVEELRSAGADDRRLREVDVAVDESRRDQRILAEVLDARAARKPRADLSRRADLGDPAVGDDDDRVGLV